MEFDNEFKQALAELPSKEKDKLILRFLKKDVALANRLHFELVNTMTVEEKQNEMVVKIEKLTSACTNSYYSPGILLMEMRDISGRITGHVKTTKDKFGEVYLNLLMLNKIVEKNKNNLLDASFSKSYTFNIYVIARVFKILSQIIKLHEDLQYDLKEELERLGTAISQQPNLMKLSINNGLNVNWLVFFDIPENIDEQMKELRKNGFLK